MKKRIFCLAIILCVSAFFLISCSGSKGPAEMAIKAAEEVVNATKAEAVKILPDEVKSLEDTLVAVKERFIKKEYKEALAEATALSAKAKDVLEAAKVKKEELTNKWTEMSETFPKMVEEVKAKVDSLDKLKKLPAGMSKEALAEAKAGIVSVEGEWGKALENVTAGNLKDAVGMADSLKDKVFKIMTSLGMNISSTDPQ